jgi:hypothetical protein
VLAQEVVVLPMQSPAVLRQPVASRLLPEAASPDEARVAQPEAQQKSAELPAFP